ncbi:MAG: FAD-dependent oxidoreductase [Gammaproteobacteria bacterium]
MNESSRGITRRQLIGGAGAAALGAVTLRSPQAASTINWDHTVDVVVVGTGIGAATAAYVANKKGNSVNMVEKAEYFGGTTARSAGVMWIPNNFIIRDRGDKDSKQDCLHYLTRYSFPQYYNPDSETLGISEYAYSLLEAFYDNGAAAIDLLRQDAVLKLHEWRMYQLDIPAPDYLDHVAENKSSDGRALGVIIGDGGTGLGAHLMAQMKAGIDKRKIPVLLGHRAERVVINDEGRVIGLEANRAGKTIRLRARKAVIFATGGYAHNEDFVENYQRSTIYGACASPMSTGDFIRIAGAAGARMGNLGGAWRTQVLLEQALDNRFLSSGVFFPPGDSIIQVNRYGLRVVNEKRNYNDRTEIHNSYDPSKAEFPNHIMLMLYDQRSAEAFAGNHPFPKDGGDANYIIKGDTLDLLVRETRKRLLKIAGRTGGFSLDESFLDNLPATIKRFNGFAESGIDIDFQRGEADYDREWQKVFSARITESHWPINDKPNNTMYPISDKGPYYGILLGPGALDTNGGPLIDANARILDGGDKPIPGLYGAGNCIASPSGEAYWGAGHTIGLALTFGYIAAQAADAEEKS